MSRGMGKGRRAEAKAELNGTLDTESSSDDFYNFDIQLLDFLPRVEDRYGPNQTILLA